MLNNTDFANYTNDTKIDSLKTVWDDLFLWLASNQLKTNPGMCHIIASCDNEMSICVKN